MKVLMLGWEFPPHISGGLGTACHGLARALVRRGTSITFVLPHASGDEPAEGMRIVGLDSAPAGAEFEVVPVDADLRPYDSAAPAPGPWERRPDDAAPAPRKRGRYGPDLFREVGRYRDAARRLAKRGRFEVVHAHDWMTFPAAIAAAKAAKAPLVIHVHSCEFDRTGPRADPRILAIEQEGLDAADAVICVSRYTADVLAARYDLDPAKVRIVHNAPPEETPPRRRGGRRRIPEPVVLFLGRVTYQKGPDVFLEAAARVARRRKDVKFVVAGSGDLYHGSIERAADLGLARRVHFTGFLRGGEVDRAWRDADLYVLPSVSEPFGIAPLEAVRAGVPVLVSSRSGVAEVLPSAPRFDPWDVEDLARRILELLADRDLRRRVVARTRRDAAKLHWDAQAAKVRAVYREVAR